MQLEPDEEDEKRRLIMNDKKMRIIIVLSWGDVKMIVRPSRISKGRLTKPFTLQKGLKTVTVHEAQDGSLDESKHDHPPVADLQMTVKDQEVHCSERYLKEAVTASWQSATTMDDGRSV